MEESGEKAHAEGVRGATGSMTAAPQPDLGANGDAARAHLDDWTAASLAHASILLTLILGSAGGVGAPVGLAVPLVMHLSYRGRSRFASFQALQAFVYQVAGLLIGMPVFIAVLAMLIVWTVAGWIVGGLLAPVLIGFLLMPFALAATLLLVAWAIGAPLAWLGYGLYAAYQTYQGRHFRYWLLGEWLE